MAALSADTLLAARLLAEGDLAAALPVARRGLEAEPDNAPLWNLLGVCAARLGQGELAGQCWTQALACDPLLAEARYNQGCLALEQGRPADAEAAFRAELALRPEHAASLGNLGIALERQGQDENAADCYRQALATDPGCAWAGFNLGRLLGRAGRREEARDYLRGYLQAEPDDADALQLLGQLQAELGEGEEAERLLRRALRLAPTHAAALNNLGLLLHGRRQWAEAEALLRAACAQAPEGVLPNLAALLSATSRSAEAEALLRPLLSQRPDDPEWLNLLGVLLQDQGRLAEAEACWRRGLAQAPAHRRLRQNLGYQQLARGDWQAGWENHEARLASGHYPRPASPRWQGESLAGKHLLLIFEQGYGDAIQFFRYLPMLLARGPARVTALCRQPLLDLFAAQGLAVAWRPLSARPDFPPHDCHAFSMSLPLRLQPRPTASSAYLRVPPAAQARWRERLAVERPRVGLVWRGRAAHPFDHCRSLPGPAALAPWLRQDGVRFLALQPEPTEEEQAWAGAQGLAEWGSQLDDFADAAALLAQLDGLIAVDTAMAHLAGALGLPCLLLLAAEHADWRWGMEGETTPWYPSLRLLRQRRGESWEDAIRRAPGWQGV
ncbi:pilus assembly protein PilF [Xenophilus sp. AP218F]|nr:pilus assembly protein PilF [Xenophilus sp. AP218F]